VYQFAIIGGTGWMGSAMLKPALQRGLLSQAEVAVSNSDGALLSGFPDVSVFADSQDMAHQSRCVVLSVRPEHFPSLAIDLSGKLVISIMAGVSVAQIQAATGATNVIRAMPNAAAEVGESYTPYFATDSVTADELKLAAGFFAGFGQADALQSEDELGYFVALTGSGHGTVAFFASALIQAATEQGIEPALAEKAVRQLMKGMGRLVSDEANSPATTVERVITYGGTTCRLVETMKEQGVDKGIAQALQASYLRATSDMTKQPKE
jgi:pyrroline-5-carboxylate reductase